MSWDDYYEEMAENRPRGLLAVLAKPNALEAIELAVAIRSLVSIEDEVSDDEILQTLSTLLAQSTHPKVVNACLNALRGFDAEQVDSLLDHPALAVSTESCLSDVTEALHQAGGRGA